jgi:hypothetical protein
MTTSVQICSNALLMLGKTPIASFTDGNDRSNYCANLYPMVRDTLLRKHLWNCAIKRVLLSPLSTAPAFTYGQQYQLPADFLRVVEVGYLNRWISEYAIESGLILAGYPTTSTGTPAGLPLRYVWRNDNEDTWDSALIHVATLAMAGVLAYPLTQSTSLRDSLKQELQIALREAKALDGSENPSETFGDEFPLLQGRY